MSVFDIFKKREQPPQLPDLGLLRYEKRPLLFGVKDAPEVLEEDVDLMLANTSLGDIRGKPFYARILSRTEFEELKSPSFASMVPSGFRFDPFDVRLKTDITRAEFLRLGEFQHMGLQYAQARLAGTAPSQFNVFDLWHGQSAVTSDFMCLMGFHDYSVHGKSEIEVPSR